MRGEEFFMFFKKEIVTDGRVLLLDEAFSEKLYTNLKRLETVDGQETILLTDSELAINLEEILEKIYLETLLVFPGNGSNYPRRKSQICKEYPGTTSVYAKRFWQPGSDPEVTTGLILPDMYLVLGVKNIVVVDDVVSSGLTMRNIYQKNAWRFPGTTWKACTWISQVLSSGKINGYKEVMTGILVRKTKGAQKVPINSLSTLRENSAIAESYANRHFKNPKEFLSIIV